MRDGDDESSWIGPYYEAELLRKPPSFDQILGRSIQYQVAGQTHSILVRYLESSHTNTAISQRVMRGGIHTTRFQIDESGGGLISLGIMRPIIKIPYGRIYNNIDPTTVF